MAIVSQAIGISALLHTALVAQGLSDASAHDTLDAMPKWWVCPTHPGPMLSEAMLNIGSIRSLVDFLPYVAGPKVSSNMTRVSLSLFPHPLNPFVTTVSRETSHMYSPHYVPLSALKAVPLPW